MKILWTNCSERMPPNTKDRVIVVGKYVKEPHYYYGSFINEALTEESASQWEWTPYTPEKWEELNALDRKWLDDLPEFLKRQAD